MRDNIKTKRIKVQYYDHNTFEPFIELIDPDTNYEIITKRIKVERHIDKNTFQPFIKLIDLDTNYEFNCPLEKTKSETEVDEIDEDAQKYFKLFIQLLELLFGKKLKSIYSSKVEQSSDKR